MKKLLVLAMAASSLTGCAIFNVGKGEFSCPGMPNGIVCKSTGEIYELTGQDRLQATVGDPVDMTVNRSVADYENDGSAMVKSPSASLYQSMSSKSMVKPAIGALPVLQPAQVLRIWVAPWVDSGNNLVWPTYVFTQVQGRTWSFGNTDFKGSKPLVPVQLSPRAERPKEAAE